jgi:hypothetical protein
VTALARIELLDAPEPDDTQDDEGLYIPGVTT